MNIQLLQWGLFNFMLGLILSIPLAAVHYKYPAHWTKVFINPRKLTSAHTDFFMQAFALGLIYVIESVLEQELPLFVKIPLIFGSVCNPLILLLEATALRRSRITMLLRTVSPASLYVAWFYVAFSFLPWYLGTLFSVMVLTGILLVFLLRRTYSVGSANHVDPNAAEKL